MKIPFVDVTFIGARLRKPNWNTVSMTVLDVGYRFIWGQLYDHAANHVIGIEVFGREENDWELYVDAKKLISLLPIKK